MPRLLSTGLEEALVSGPLRSYGTLQLLVDADAEVKAYYLATATLNFNGVNWAPELREIGEITASIVAEADEATVLIQNVDTVFGKEFVAIEEFLSSADATIGRYWKGDGFEAHEILMTGLVTGFEPNEQAVRLTVVPDTYSGVSVGPFRSVRRLCQAKYKSFECGRPPTDPPTCDYTLNGSGGCDGRWGSTNKFVRHMGAPFLDNQVFQKII